MTRDPETLAHLEWLGYVQPVGLVVSIPALLNAQAHVNRNISPQHAKLLTCLPRDRDDSLVPEIREFTEFARAVLDWRESDLEKVVSGDPRYSELEVHLPEYHETLAPTYVVREYEPKDAEHPWMMLIQSLHAGTQFDKLQTTEHTHWQATPHAKFERLLRETKVPLGLLVSPSHLRLVYAPRGETSGYMTFSVAEMAQVAGRPIFAALHMLLSEERLFSLGEKQRLPAILADSRKYQNHVSNELAQQVLAALFELLRGFQAADDATKGELLREVLAANPNHVYGGLLTVLMRLVFVLYAEDRDLVSSDPVYSNHYSVTGLFERLRADAGRYPDTMDQRFGAWAQLLTLFRLIYDGGSHGNLSIPARKGYLFDPDRYNFLEGRHWQAASKHLDTVAAIPRVSDGIVYRVLHNLLILDAERLSYRTLDVEQIGSVYETMMGFAVEVAEGRSIALKPKKPHGAPTTIDLEALLEVKPADRGKWLKERADQELTGQAATALKAAHSVDDLLSALDRKIAKNVTPNVMSKGSMVFQPSDERRKSGSHYTPRALTEPIVRTTLRPVLEQLGEKPKPEQILALKVCDPAMGSGAFLVEACRQLGDELVKAWHVHNSVPKLPPDEDELLHARRLIAQRSLYGVDKNPMAVDLSKLSLWLATLAKDHPFTFLDHSLRTGDSLVGLSREQVAAFHWQPTAQRDLLSGQLRDRINRATEYRAKILAARDDVPYEHLRQCLDVADEALSVVRFIGDLAVAAFFAGDNAKKREQGRVALATQLEHYLSSRSKSESRQPLSDAVASLHGGDRPIQPFHWQVEFPEVFTIDQKGKQSGGFDAVVGNPPFAGKNTLIDGTRGGYIEWLKTIHDESHGNADLVAHFFRRSFNILRLRGCFGLIATKTIGQGDTRSTGLRWTCTHGGVIYSARKRLKWPGQAAVIVSVVHQSKGPIATPPLLNGKVVPTITAYLFHKGGHDNPTTLSANSALSFQGCIPLGMGFTFDDNAEAASPISLMNELLRRNPRCADRVFPFIGWEEVANSPQHLHDRYIINFGSMTIEEAGQWPELLSIVEQRVKPERLKQKDPGGREFWWRFLRPRAEMQDAISGLRQVIVTASQAMTQYALAMLPNKMVYSSNLTVIAMESFSAWAILQSRVHEVWARLFCATLKDDLAYAPSDCFVNFPFPEGFATSDQLENAGQRYYEKRAALMVSTHEGLTETYNHFHHPDVRSPEITALRELHATMDQAVLKAYGWHDLAETATCEFLLDFEISEDDEEPSGRARARKKPWRLRWPDDFRDEVLARLLDLNQKRAEEERLAGIAAEAAAKTTRSSNKNRSAPKTKKSGPQTLGLFDNSPAEGDA